MSHSDYIVVLILPASFISVASYHSACASFFFTQRETFHSNYGFAHGASLVEYLIRSILMRTLFLLLICVLSVGTTELHYSTKKRQQLLHILKAFFVQSDGYIFRFTFRSLSDVSYPDECQTDEKSFQYVKNGAAFSYCNMCFILLGTRY